MLVVLLARWGCRDVFNASLDHLILKLVSPRMFDETTFLIFVGVRDVLLVASVIRLRAPLVAIAVLALLLILRALHFVSLALRANLFLVLDQRSVSSMSLTITYSPNQMSSWVLCQRGEIFFLHVVLPKQCSIQSWLNFLRELHCRSVFQRFGL